jgi:quercetin dioxygenase-like cupin family protein
MVRPNGGSLHLQVAEQDHELEAGDAIYFDSHVPHAYRRAGTRTCSAVVITAP